MFEKGRSLNVYPVKLIHLGTKTETGKQVKAMFVVPKKKFKHANDRNKLKRRMREAYRLQKEEFYTKMESVKLSLAFLYSGSKAEEYEVIFKAIDKLLNNLTKQNATSGA